MTKLNLSNYFQIIEIKSEQRLLQYEFNKSYIKKLKDKVKLYFQNKNIKERIKSNPPFLLSDKRSEFALYCNDKIYSSKNEEGFYKTKYINTNTNNNRVIIVHAFYYEESIEMFNQLEKYKDYDILISTSNDKVIKYFLDNCNFKNWKLIRIENIGRDIYPFLFLCQFIKLNQYEYFIKIHSKRSSHLGGEGLAWYFKNIYSLIGNYDVTNEIIKFINLDSTSIYGTNILDVSHNYEENKLWIDYHISSEIIDENKLYNFIPGTMFIGTGKFLQLVKNKNYLRLKFEDENGQLDGCLGHSLERIFGLITSTDGECQTFEYLVNNEAKKIKG